MWKQHQNPRQGLLVRKPDYELKEASTVDSQNLAQKESKHRTDLPSPVLQAEMQQLYFHWLSRYLLHSK